MRGVKKIHLPEKTCPVCARPFAWRRRWARDWDRVIYCSERCRRNGSDPIASSACAHLSAGSDNGHCSPAKGMAGLARSGRPQAAP